MAFIGRELLEAAVDLGVLVRPPIEGVRYFAFADPSGGVHDSFALGVSHLESDGSVPLDLMYEHRAPFNPSEVTEEIAALLKSYHCTQVVGDRYAAKWVVEAFDKTGISYRQSDVDRSAIYLDVLPLFTSGRARLLDSSRLIGQFAGLERRTFSTGRDRVDHGRNGRDDIANACAGALVLAPKRNLFEPVICPPVVVYGEPRAVPGGSLLCGDVMAPGMNTAGAEPWRKFIGPSGNIIVSRGPPGSGPTRGW